VASSRTSEVNLVNDSSGSEECVWSPRTFGIRAQLVNIGSLFKLIRRRLFQSGPSGPCQLHLEVDRLVNYRYVTRNQVI